MYELGKLYFIRLLACVACGFLFRTVAAQETGDLTASSSASALTSLSIEALMNIEVTSVSKHAEKQWEAPAAIAVLTQDDIRRSGATSIPEVLRTVPGIYVAKLDANTWSVTSRCFGGRYADKLLVLIDGREIYTPLYSGVEWESQHVPLEEIERIEVIRGPGGSLWGANAVNGVINIVTKKASDTQGGLVSLIGGTEEKASAFLRYGGALGDEAWFRAYANYADRDDGRLRDGGAAHDDSCGGQGGFRVDKDFGKESSLTVEGDIYNPHLARTDEMIELWPPYNRAQLHHVAYHGGNIAMTFRHRVNDRSAIELETHYSRYSTGGNEYLLDESRNTFNLDFQHHYSTEGRHDFVWGVGFRYMDDSFDTNRYIALDPDARSYRLFSAFVQDTISFSENRLKLTLGAKLEHNDFSGVEVQPTARLAWTPHEDTTWWAAISRAVRTPSRVEKDVRVLSMSMPFFTVSMQGQDDFDSAELWAYEAGVRRRLSERLTADAAVFLNQYGGLRMIDYGGLSFDPRSFPPHLDMALAWGNDMEATVWGGELALDWSQTAFARMRVSYNYSHAALDLHSSFDPYSSSTANDVPQHQFSLTEQFNFGNHWEADLIFRYMDQQPVSGAAGYADMDARLSWTPLPSLEIALVGQNLFHDHKQEYLSAFANTIPTENERGVYGKVTWQF